MKPERDWRAAKGKVLQEYVCRVPNCGSTNLDTAHVIGRTHDYAAPVRDPGEWRPGRVWPDRVIPLCAEHHREQHAGRLDLLPLLTVPEQVQAVADAGGIEQARERLLRAGNPRRVVRRRVVRRDPDLLGGA